MIKDYPWVVADQLKERRWLYYNNIFVTKNFAFTIHNDAHIDCD